MSIRRKQITPYSPCKTGSPSDGSRLCAVIVLNERHLRRLLSELVAYYHDDRTHLGLAKGTPAMRTPRAKLPGDSEVVALPRIGGLHHRYEWRAAA